MRAALKPKSNFLTVILTPEEIEDATQVGKARADESFENNREGRNGQPQDERMWDNHIQGALAEQAVAKKFNKPWNHGVNTFREVEDVDNVGVRWTGQYSGPLYLRDWDKDKGIMVLIVGGPEEYSIRGWISVKDGKRLGTWRQPDPSRPGCWCVSQNLLNKLPHFDENKLDAPMSVLLSRFSGFPDQRKEYQWILVM